MRLLHPPPRPRLFLNRVLRLLLRLQALKPQLLLNPNLLLVQDRKPLPLPRCPARLRLPPSRGPCTSPLSALETPPCLSPNAPPLAGTGTPTQTAGSSTSAWTGFSPKCHATRCRTSTSRPVAATGRGRLTATPSPSCRPWPTRSPRFLRSDTGPRSAPRPAPSCPRTTTAGSTTTATTVCSSCSSARPCSASTASNWPAPSPTRWTAARPGGPPCLPWRSARPPAPPRWPPRRTAPSSGRAPGATPRSASAATCRGSRALRRPASTCGPAWTATRGATSCTSSRYK